MAYRDRFPTFALLSLLALPLGTAACSQGSSPTEPALDLDSTAAGSTFTSAADESRRGRGGETGNAGRQHRRGRRNDDAARQTRRGRRNDDGAEDRQPRAPRAGQEFEGAVAAVAANSLTLASGLTVMVDGATAWNRRGDLFSLGDVAAALAAGQAPRVEGRGARQADGTLLARSIKAELDGDDD